MLLKDIKSKLGANYKETDNDLLDEILDDITSIACDISNRKKSDEKLEPYIRKAVVAEYLCRGAEGLTSRSEGSISSSYNDIVGELRNNIIKSGLRRII